MHVVYKCGKVSNSREQRERESARARMREREREKRAGEKEGENEAEKRGGMKNHGTTRAGSANVARGRDIAPCILAERTAARCIWIGSLFVCAAPYRGVVWLLWV